MSSLEQLEREWQMEKDVSDLRCVSVRHFCQIEGSSKKTVHKAIKEGRLKAFKNLSGHYQIPLRVYFEEQGIDFDRLRKGLWTIKEGSNGK